MSDYLLAVASGLDRVDDEDARQWERDHPNGISAEELESMDRYAYESCVEEGLR